MFNLKPQLVQPQPISELYRQNELTKHYRDVQTFTENGRSNVK